LEIEAVAVAVAAADRSPSLFRFPGFARAIRFAVSAIFRLLDPRSGFLFGQILGGR
jgi:hypothetical protein